MLQYFRKGKQKKGVMVAIISDNQQIVKFGYSLCRTTMDKFSVGFGKKLAIARAECGRKLYIPSSMEKSFKKFHHRCILYYKDKLIDKNYEIANNKQIENVNNQNKLFCKSN